MPIQILIVDDHPIVRVGVAAMIARYDELRVSGLAGSGEEALEQYAKNRPDIVLLDLRLPGMSGLETLQIIRKMTPGHGSLYSPPMMAMRIFTARCWRAPRDI
jgi:DNA-binding NarL/FixJ family response regulator